MSTKELVNVTNQFKSMMANITPTIHMYRVDAIVEANIVIHLSDDKFTEDYEIKLDIGYSIDPEDLETKIKNRITENKISESGNQVISFASIGAFARALLSVKAPEDIIAKYTKPKKCKVTVDDLLNNAKISDSLKDMIAKEIDNI